MDRLITLVLRRPALVLAVAFALCIPGTYGTVLLFGDVRANVRELLPENARSVQTLKNLEKRFGGFSELSIVVESPDREASRRFSDDLVRELKSDGEIQSVRNKLGEERAFFEKRGGLYLELSDLEDLEERIADAANDARRRANPLLVDLEEDKEPVKVDVSDIEAKYTSKGDLVGRFPNSYFESADGKSLAVIIRQRGFAFTISKNQQLVKRVEQTIAKLDPKKYHSEMVTGIGGDVKNLIEEQETLVEDLVIASIAVQLLLAMVILLYYRRIRALFLLLIPVLVGSSYTFGVGHVLVGHLNASSAFLGSIIAGNGVNFGIILLARFMEERNAGQPLENCIRVAMHETFSGTSSAALAASIAYGSLMATDFLGFKHFGIIGGAGMLLCWCVTFTVLPSMLVLLERRWPMTAAKEINLLPRGVFINRFASALLGNVRVVAWGAAAVTLACVITTGLFLRDPFEKNFHKLRSTTTHKFGSAYWGKKVDGIFGRYLTPQVVLAERAEDVPLIVAELRKAIEAGGDRAPISSVTAFEELVPRQQAEKLEVLGRIRTLLTDDLLTNLSPEERKRVERFRPDADLTSFTKDDLPEIIRSEFRELDGTEGRVVLVFPNNKLNLFHADEIKRVAALLRSIPLPDGRVVESSGNFVIYSDMLDAVSNDGPRATLYSFLGVMILCAFVFRKISRVLLVISSLLAGVAILGAGFVVFDLKINFLNFIGLPITFGIGVDYAVNVYSRYMDEVRNKSRVEAMHIAIASTGGAVMVCSATTVIGYASLLLARNGALNSFGEVAILGELSTLFAGLVFLPAWALAWHHRE